MRILLTAIALFQASNKAESREGVSANSRSTMPKGLVAVINPSPCSRSQPKSMAVIMADRRMAFHFINTVVAGWLKVKQKSPCR